MSNNIIQSLIDEGALVLLHDYRDGHAQDLSGQGNHGTITAAPWAGHEGLQFPSGVEQVAVPDAASLQITAGTLIIVGPPFKNQQASSRLISKRDGGGLIWDWYINATQVVLYDGTNARTLVTSIIGKRSLITTFEDGEIPETFLDGVSAGAHNGVSAISVDDAPIRIGSYLGNTQPFKNVISVAAVCNRRLTATEVSRVHAELLQHRPSTRRYYSARASVQVDPQETGLVAGYDVHSLAGSVIDVSSGGRDMPKGMTQFAVETPIGPGLRFDGTEDISAGISSAVDLQSVDCSCECWFKRNPGMSVNGNVVANDKNNHRRAIEAAVGSVRATFYDAGVYHTAARSNHSLEDALTHAILTWNETTGESKLYVDGVLADGAITHANIASTGKIAIGGSGNGSNLLDGVVIKSAWYNYTMDQAEVTRRYQQGARALQFATGFGSPVSIAAEGGEIGQYLSGTPFQFGDAALRAQVAASDQTYGGTTRLSKMIESTNSGELLYLPNSIYKFASPTEAAYGTWDFMFVKGAGQSPRIQFITDTIADAGSGNNYNVLLADTDGKIYLRRGTVTLVSSASAVIVDGQLHRIQITRSAAGVFKVYVDETLAITHTDTTYTTSTYFVVTFKSSSDKLLLSSFDGAWQMRKHAGVLDIT